MPTSFSELRKAGNLDRIIVAVALVLVVVGCFFVLKPFLSALLWAVILTFSSWPAYRVLLGWVRGRRSLAALLMTLGIALVLLVPSVVIVLKLAGDVKEFANTSVAWARQGPPLPPDWVARVPWIGEELGAKWREYAADTRQLLTALEPYIEPLTAWILVIGKALGQGILELALSLFFAFFFFRDGARLGDWILAIAKRLADERGDYLLREIAGGTIRGVVYGILGTAMVQGLFAVIGFSIAGVPAAVLLGLVTFFLSPIPMGPPLIWIPATIWVFQNGSVGMGVFLLLWGFLVISSIDNLIRPLIISQGNKMPFILIFMGVVGGGFAFGLIGIFLGPTLLAVSYRLVEEWLELRKKPLVLTPEEAVAEESPPLTPETP